MTVGRKYNAEIPFPQADDPFKAMGVVVLVAGCRTVDDDKIAETFDMVGRQGAYYGNAAAFLGYINAIGGYWRLTKSGKHFMGLTKGQREKEIAAAIIDLPAFEYAAEHIAIMGDLPRDKDTASMIQEADERVNDTTAFRRAKTVNAWVGLVWKTCPQAIQDIQDALNAG